MTCIVFYPIRVLLLNQNGCETAKQIIRCRSQTNPERATVAQLHCSVAHLQLAPHILYKAGGPHAAAAVDTLPYEGCGNFKV